MRDLAHTAAGDARDAVDALRRHLFTLVERLRERLREQVDINDETTTVLTQDADDTRQDALGALGSRQDETRTKSAAISEALKKQAEQAGSQSTPQQGGAQGPTQQERYQKAAKHVDQAVQAMTTSTEAAKADPLEADAVRTAQAKAAEELAKALAMLQPPQDKNQDQKQQQQQQQQQQDQKKQDKQEKQDSGGALQAVRDREAKRRAKKDKKGVVGEGTVEKDW